jgi:hypothetical protein
MKPIRLLVAWNMFSKGHVIPAMPAAQAEFLVRGGFAEYFAPETRSPVQEAMRGARNYVTRAKR